MRPLKLSTSPSLLADDRRPPLMPPVSAAVPAAVMVLCHWRDDDWHIVLTRRAAHLRHHAGQISFPGGAAQDNETTWQTACRETAEEIGLNPSALKHLGKLGNYITRSNFAISAEVAWLQSPLPNLRPNPNEVADILHVPLRLLRQSNFSREIIQPSSQLFWALLVDDNYIWGATAALLYQLRSCLHEDGDL